MKYILKLYIAGQTPNSVRAIKNLNKICNDHLANEVELNIIDVLQEPNLAEEDKIVAIPTLIKKLPLPLRKMIGDLSDMEKVIFNMDLVKIDLTEEDAQ